MQNSICQPCVMPCLTMRSQVQKERGAQHSWRKDGSTIQPKCSNITFCCEDRLAGFFKNPFCSLIDGEEGLLLPVWHPRFPTSCPWWSQVPAWNSDQPEKNRKFFNFFFLFSSCKIQKSFWMEVPFSASLSSFFFSGCELCQLFCLSAE